MKIDVAFIPSEYKARYGYKTRNIQGKVLVVGVQFDPFEEFKD